jgi:hypothetical protein
VKVLDIGRYIVNPEHPEHVQWVTCLVSMYFQLPGIVYRSLRGAVDYHAETLGDGGR